MDTMTESNLARVAGMIGEPSRAEMLAALLGGEWLTAGELARRARIGASTASEHLARMVERGLLVQRRSGRHRYYTLANEDVAAALESLARLSSDRRPAREHSPEQRALRFARTCYDHLAGSVGVRVTDALFEGGILAMEGYAVTPHGAEWLSRLEIDLDALRRERRALVRPCLDWSERRDHVAGAVGAALLEAMIGRRWLVRIPGTRAVRLPPRGREGLYRVLGLEIEPPG